MNRWKAAATHLALSLIVIASLFGIVLTLWYPPALLRMSQLDSLIVTIAVVDIVAGPLLTLIVYKQGKRSLRFDLAVIAAIQLALLSYGLHTLAQVRPVFLVGVVDRFEMVAANDIEPADLAAAAPEFRHLSWTGPIRVGAAIPADADEANRVLARALAGSDIQTLPRYYVPFDQVQAGLLARSLPVADLLTSATPDERDALQRAGDGRADLRYVPLSGRRGSAIMLLAPATGELIGPADIDPWGR